MKISMSLLVLVLALVHAPRLQSDDCCKFVSYDDPANFEYNPYIQQLTWSNVYWALTDGVILREWILTRSRIGPHQGVWEPTSLIFRMAYHTLLGKSAYVCLVVSVALHTTNICAVFVVMVRQYSNHGRWVACCTYSALVVALHPLSVEAICWASAQGYPLAGLFSVCSVAAQLSHTSTSTSAMLPHCKRAVVCGSYACAVLAKPAALPLPALLLVIDYHRELQLEARHSQNHTDPSHKRNLLGIRAAAAAVRANLGVVLLAALLTFVATRANPDLEQVHTRRHPHTGIGLVEQLARAGAALSHQLRNTLGLGRLEQLSVRYRWQHQDDLTAGVAVYGGLLYFGAATLVTAVASCLVLVGPPRIGKVAVAVCLCWLCYIALVLPTTGLIVQHGVPMLTADRYSYLPLLLLGTPALAHTLHITVGTLSSNAVVDVCLGTVATAVVAVEAQATVSYSAMWFNSTSLWQHVVSSNPRDAPALSELAGALLEELPTRDGSQAVLLGEALQWYDKAVALEPVQLQSSLSSPILAARTQNADDHRFGDIWSNRGLVLGALGGPKLFEALSSFEYAATVYGGQEGAGFSSPLAEAGLFTNWGAVLAGMDRHQEAVDVLQQAARLNPGDASVYLRLATELKAIEAYEEEVQAYDAALAIIAAQYCSEASHAQPSVMTDEDIAAETTCWSPANSAGSANMFAQAALAVLLPPATASYGVRSTIKQVAQLNRCVALERLGRQLVALDCYDKLLASTPEYSRALANRATVLYSLGRASEAVKGYRNALEAAAASDEVSALTQASWLNNRGFVLSALATGDGAVALQHEHEAMANFRAAIALEAESGLPSGGKAATNLAKLESRQREREEKKRFSSLNAAATSATVDHGVRASAGRPVVIKHASELTNLAQQAPDRQVMSAQ